jgi:pentatricopeptide repeat protein
MLCSLMGKQGIQPNVAFQTAIIKQLMQNETVNMGVVMDMLERMKSNPETMPNEQTYSTILAGLYRQRNLDWKQAEAVVEEVKARMQGQKLKLTTRAYTILIKASLDRPGPEGLQHGLAYFRQMKKLNIAFAHSTWYTLLSGLLRRKELELARDSVREMLASGYEPDDRLMELVRRIERAEERVQFGAYV